MPKCPPPLLERPPPNEPPPKLRVEELELPPKLRMGELDVLPPKLRLGAELVRLLGVKVRLGSPMLAPLPNEREGVVGLVTVVRVLLPKVRVLLPKVRVPLLVVRLRCGVSAVLLPPKL